MVLPSARPDRTTTTPSNRRPHTPSRANVRIDAIPSELKDRAQWVGWQYQSRPNSPKLKKVPINPSNGQWADTNDPRTWGRLEQALTRCEQDGLAGVGFVFSDADSYCGIDLDHCRNQETGEVEPWAEVLVRRLGSYTEPSPSGTGLHVIVRGSLPKGSPHRVALNNGEAGVEIYDAVRYFTMTGEKYDRGPRVIADRQDAVDELLDALAAVKAGAACRASSDPARALAKVLLDSEAAAYWIGNTNEKDRDASRADQALAFRLALAIDARPDCPEDVARIDALLRQSGLATLPGRSQKWARPDYLSRSIMEAVRFAYAHGSLPCRKCQPWLTLRPQSSVAEGRLMLSDLASLRACKNLTLGEKVVSEALLVYLESQPAGWVPVNESKLGDQAGAGRKVASRAIKALCGYGVIETSTVPEMTGGGWRTPVKIRLAAAWRLALAGMANLHFLGGKERGSPLNPIVRRSTRQPKPPVEQALTCDQCGAVQNAHAPGARSTSLRQRRPRRSASPARGAS